MSEGGLGERYAVARRLAREAGAVIQELATEARRVPHFKGAIDLVTEVDEAAQALILRALVKAFPADRIIAEEGDEGADTPAESGWTWVVDPLDGTTNYVHGVQRYAVSIAALHDGLPTIGVVYEPPTRRTWHAAIGAGACIDDRPIRTSDARELSSSLLATGFPYDRATNAAELIGPLQRALERARGVRRMGSAALDLCDVAGGVFDGYWEARLAPWDVAAGVVLVNEAGGRVSDYRGGSHTPWSDSVVASNALIDDALLAMVSG